MPTAGVFPARYSTNKTMIGSTTAAIQTALNQRPVAVAIDTSSTTFQTYAGGIISASTCPQPNVNYAAVITGNDDTNSPGFWYVRFSLGTNWGEQGYARLAKASGSGTCGINLYPWMVEAYEA